jgi:hypothetical protein
VSRNSREWIASQILPFTLTQYATATEAITAALDIAQEFLDIAQSRTATEVTAAAGSIAVGPRL